jgi:M6 family metalloprotease-like protein
MLMTIAVVVITLSAMAVPAKRGQWKTLKLVDGTEINATLVGDEFGHFWKGEDGNAYKLNGDFYQQIDAKATMNKAKARKQQVNAKRVMRMTLGTFGHYFGLKKGLIILVNFKDKAFNADHTQELYNRIANEKGFSEGSFKGSMSDYFLAQSRGQFELDFDVVGPVTVSNDASYYGSNDENDEDMHAAEMVIEAVNLIKDDVTNWQQYDWDGDGEVDQVYLIYAGKGEANGGAENTIWPHAYTLKESADYEDGTGPVTVAENLTVNSYACGPELNGKSKIDGIGTICHEFSHCLGYPDFYDIDYSGGQGMGYWDLMCAGSYNGDGYQPAGYTSYEMWMAGWLEPIELDAEDVQVQNMKSLQSGGESYIIYNKGNKNEFLMLENRQQEGWDASLPDAGMLIVHCDYDKSVWEQNGPNDDPDHQRMVVVPADGNSKNSEENDVFPQSDVTSFNKDFKTSDKIAKKAAQFFNKNTNGTYWIDSSVEEITQNSDGTISFNFVAEYTSTSGNGGTTTDVPEGAVFYESFNDCAGTGANDGNWGSGASEKFAADNDGWDAEALYGGYQCARFGSSKKSGVATSPTITLAGNTHTLTFKAASWGNDGTGLKLSATGATVLIEPSEFTMKSNEWTTFTATISGTGDVKLVFTPAKRFFLDEVVVMDTIVQTGIETAPQATKQTSAIYNLNGQKVTNPKSGLYIINGRKVVIK